MENIILSQQVKGTMIANVVVLISDEAKRQLKRLSTRSIVELLTPLVKKTRHISWTMNNNSNSILEFSEFAVKLREATDYLPNPPYYNANNLTLNISQKLSECNETFTGGYGEFRKLDPVTLEDDTMLHANGNKINSLTPWYQSIMRDILKKAEPMPYDTLEHPVGCLVVLWESDPPAMVIDVLEKNLSPLPSQVFNGKSLSVWETV